MSLSPELVALLACPESREPLVHVPAGVLGPDEFLYCAASRLRYRIDQGIPVILVEEAERLDDETAAALAARLGDATR